MWTLQTQCTLGPGEGRIGSACGRWVALLPSTEALPITKTTTCNVVWPWSETTALRRRQRVASCLKMDAHTILNELTSESNKRVAVALRAVPEHAEALRNRVGKSLNACAARSLADPDDDSVTEAFWWMFVAAATRAPGSHAAIATLIGVEEGTCTYRWGDLVTEYAPVILADTFEGDREPLLRLVRNEEISPWVRTAALHAIARLVESQEWDRPTLVSLLEEQIEEVLLLERRSRIEEWDDGRLGDLEIYSTSVVGVVAFEVGAVELAPAVSRLVATGLYDQMVAGLDDVEAALSGRNPFPRRRVPSLSPDLWGRLRMWACFDPKPDRPVPRIREKVKIGRNDPCPCGSGRKYKKCCGK